MKSIQHPYVVTLGTAGGPRIWGDTSNAPRSGIATAVVVNGYTYLVDAGHGVFTQMARAGLPMSSVRGIFITHLHSDHTIDLNTLAVYGSFLLPTETKQRIAVLGPGNRKAFPNSTDGAKPNLVSPQNPTTGLSEMFNAFMTAHATDINDRIINAKRPSPVTLFEALDIDIPASAGFDAIDNPCPDMEPFEIFRDENVIVTATLVVHPPVAPAFAFRFETADGSVTISGDTSPSENLVRLAADTDLLMHEAVDFEWSDRTFARQPGNAPHASAQQHGRSHSSPEQAGEVATRAGAKKLLLHHLIPGNAPKEAWHKASRTFSGPLHIAEDLDVVPFDRRAGNQPQSSSTAVNGARSQ